MVSVLSPSVHPGQQPEGRASLVAAVLVGEAREQHLLLHTHALVVVGEGGGEDEDEGEGAGREARKRWGLGGGGEVM